MSRPVLLISLKAKPCTELVKANAPPRTWVSFILLDDGVAEGVWIEEGEAKEVLVKEVVVSCVKKVEREDAVASF